MDLVGYYLIALILLFPIQAGISAFYHWISRFRQCGAYDLNLKQLKCLAMINVAVVGLLAIPHRSLILFITSVVIGLTLFVLNTIFNYKPLITPVNASKTFNLLHIFNLSIHPTFFFSWGIGSLEAGIWDDLGWGGYNY